MRSVFKILVILLFVPTMCIGQEEQAVDTFDMNNYDQNDPETVFFNFGLFKPFALGNNSFNEAYRNGNVGLEFDFNWMVVSGFTLGAKIDVFKADVQDQTTIGAINDTRVTNYSFHLGYYKAFSREWNLHSTIGVGHVGHRNTSNDDIFREYGWNLYLQEEVNYRFNQYFGLYAKLQFRTDFMDIETVPEQDNYLNNQLSIVPGVGVRINLNNPGG